MKSILTALLILMVSSTFCQAQTTRTWDSTTGNWSDAAKWGGTVPQAGENAVINGGAVLLSADTADLASLTMGGGTLTFTNWTTSLNATDVTLNSGAEFSLPLSFTDADMSNRVYVVCSNFTLNAGAAINVDSKGFRASPASLGTPYGPGAPAVSAHYGAGAGYGGVGGYGESGPTAGGAVYGETNAPTAPGSGGGGNSVLGHGGGAVRIDATGTVTIDGTISANGGTVTAHGGGGSGGGIFISCRVFAGAAGGQLLAVGGNSKVVSTPHGGAGGGGRIAVVLGMAAADVQKLIDGEPVAGLLSSDRFGGGYAGGLSVPGGVCVGFTGDHDHTGEAGTIRFATAPSGSAFWLLVNGEPGDYDTPTPYGYGVNASLAADSWVTNTATSPFDEGGGVWRGAIGWSVTNQAGATVASGSGNQAVFQMGANLVLTYQWTNLYELAVTSANAAQGSVNSGTVDGLYTNGVTPANIVATPDAGYVFSRWTGTGVPAGQETNNPLTTTMTEPRFLTANFASTTGETRTWTGTGNWTDFGNWSPAGIPGTLDAAVIASGTVTLSDSESVATLTVNSGATMVFTNWATTLVASNVTIVGEVTLPPEFDESDMSNRVHFVCTNFALASTGSIDVKGMGFSGSKNIGLSGQGPGKGAAAAHYGGGGGYGGAGAAGTQSAGGPTYGSTNAPTDPGSGGGGNSLIGHGGGAVRIDASGDAAIDGTIDASGRDANLTAGHGGGGSGGGIFISCGTFQGAASGVLKADGGHGRFYLPANAGGGGGGGRIAVAIGMSGADVRKLIAGETVSGLTVSPAYPGYGGQVSVTNGWSASAGPVLQDRPGSPGTIRFLQVASSAAFGLVVVGDPGDYDSPTPKGYGFHANIDSGTRVTNTVTSPFDEGGGLRRACVAWSVTNVLGATLDSGAGNQAVFDMTTNLVLTFHWTNVYQLAVTSANAAQGSVNSGTVDGWYTNGATPPDITATPQGGYAFNRWTGTGVPVGHEYANPLTAPMTEPGVLVANFALIGGGVRTWSGTGNWGDVGNWTPTGIPGRLDDAYIASGTVTLTEPFAAGSLTVSNGTSVVFTNWSTTLTASNITIAGEVTLPPRFTESGMSNRVHFVCTNFHLQDGGLIDGKGCGFMGGAGIGDSGYGPGAGVSSAHYGGGGGHGGVGADGDQGAGGSTYDSTNAPLAPGSGGGGNEAGHGGGAVRIAAQGTVTIDGTIDVDGAIASYHGGSGSGGSIFISCATFEGAASGTLLARGADGHRVSTSHGGSGGGGRIAVAVGIAPEDVQRLIDRQSVTGLIATATHSTYAGSISVTNGVLESDGHIHNGAPGTHRFLQVSYGSTFTLLVRGDPGDEGSPAPLGYGLYVNIDSGTRLTNAVNSPYDDGGGYGWGCLGWTVTNAAGAPVASGSGTQAVFDVTTNQVLTYKWTNLYGLTVSSANAAQGSVNSGAVDGWYTNGAIVTGISASPLGGYVFNRWTGTGVPPGQETANPLTTSMTEPRALVANFAAIGGEARSWNGTGTWVEPGYWTPNGIPGPQDDAYISSGSVTLAEPMTVGSLTVSNGTTMVFTNWSTELTASGNITVEGEVSLPLPYEEGGMSNRVHFACATFTLGSEGLIDATGAGFIGGRGITAFDHGQGPGKGALLPGQTHYGGGGGHGGAGDDGARGVAGVIYGSTNAPMLPGSGGAGNCDAGSDSGGDGGGPVWIAASGNVTIDGTIDASASDSKSHGGGGSGGSIFISCRSFDGAASGHLLAQGGDSVWYGVTQYGGGGGGGRISVAMKFPAAALEELISGQPLRSVDAASGHASYFGAVSVTNGVARQGGIAKDGSGDEGTVHFVTYTGVAGTMILLR